MNIANIQEIITSDTRPDIDLDMINILYVAFMHNMIIRILNWGLQNKV